MGEATDSSAFWFRAVLVNSIHSIETVRPAHSDNSRVPRFGKDLPSRVLFLTAALTLPHLTTKGKGVEYASLVHGTCLALQWRNALRHCRPGLYDLATGPQR